MDKVRVWAKNLKQQTLVLYFAYKDDRVPWYAKIFIICVVSYAFSPIDLIPDFIPILGYLDDVIIVPLGILFALKMIPKEVVETCEIQAKKMIENKKPKNWLVGSLIVLVWIIIIFWISKETYQFFLV